MTKACPRPIPGACNVFWATTARPIPCAASPSWRSRLCHSSTLWAAAWFAFSLGHGWASLLIAIPAAGFLVRLFMIQHDCGHGAFFRRPPGERLGRPRHRRSHADALRLLAPHACHPPRHLRQSRPPRHRRRRYADRARISGAVALGPSELPPLPPSAGHVRPRPGLSVPAAAPAAGRPDARRLAALGQHHGDQSRDRR